MKDNLRCEIVEDLLPLYTDNLTSYFTSEAVKIICLHVKDAPKFMKS